MNRIFFIKNIFYKNFQRRTCFYRSSEGTDRRAKGTVNILEIQIYCHFHNKNFLSLATIPQPILLASGIRGIVPAWSHDLVPDVERFACRKSAASSSSSRTADSPANNCRSNNRAKESTNNRGTKEQPAISDHRPPRNIHYRKRP